MNTQSSFKQVDISTELILSEKKQQKLKTYILDITREYKLTPKNITNLLAYSNPTLSNVVIKRILANLIAQNELVAISIKNEIFIRPNFLTKVEKDYWKIINRNRSKEWLNVQLNLETVYKRSIKIYNKVSRVMSTNQTISFSSNKTIISSNGNSCIPFSTNDYLGLSKNRRVKNACLKALEQFGNGSGGSRILSGTSQSHRRLETCISNFKNTSDTIVFSSGFMTNIGLFSLFPKDCVVFFDSLSHTSLIEGMRLTKVRSERFAHNNVNDLENKLKRYNSFPHKVVIIESVYSMDGDIAPIYEISNICRSHNAKLVVDEAHSIGVLGINGRGICEELSLSDDIIDIKVGTLGKAIGAEGGYISGSSEMISILKSTATSYLFSTSLPPAIMEGAIESFNILTETNNLVQSLQKKAAYMRSEFIKFGFEIGDSQTHIIPILIRDEKIVQILQSQLEEKGFLVSVITFPAVPIGQARLRVNICDYHSYEDLNLFLKTLLYIYEKYSNTTKSI